MGPEAADIAEIVSEIRLKLPDLETPPPLAPEPARFRLFDSITTFLKHASQSQPLLLVLDDLHWADQPLRLGRENGNGRRGVQGLFTGHYRGMGSPGKGGGGGRAYLGMTLKFAVPRLRPGL